MGCPNIPDCAMFPKLKATLEIWRNRYCDAHTFDDCARYRLRASGQAVPVTLLPNGNPAPYLEV